MATLSQPTRSAFLWTKASVSVPAALTAFFFLLLFVQPALSLVRQWWTDPEAGHGMLLAPLALWLAWRSGVRSDSRAHRSAGLVVLILSVLLRYASGLAAEVFTMRLSMILALAGLIIFYAGFRQLLHWWLPLAVLTLSIPLPALVTDRLALPLQFRASNMGAALLRSRHVPVLLDGNVIEIPGHRLFVTEACSGLRSLTALFSLGVLIGGLRLRAPLTRIFLLLVVIPVAIAINGVRVFLTGFLVYFVDPKLGDGFMHLTEGWLMFVVAFAILGGLALLAEQAERWALRMRHAS